MYNNRILYLPYQDFFCSIYTCKYKLYINILGLQIYFSVEHTCNCFKNIVLRYNFDLTKWFLMHSRSITVFILLNFHILIMYVRLWHDHLYCVCHLTSAIKMLIACSNLIATSSVHHICYVLCDFIKFIVLCA